MREEGYYWVKLRNVWRVARWDSKRDIWYLDGTELAWPSISFEQIDERKIVRDGK